MEVEIKELKTHNGNIVAFFLYFGKTKYVTITPKTYERYGKENFFPSKKIRVNRRFMGDKEMFQFLGFGK